MKADDRLLDRTMILFGSNMGDANTHDNTNLPILLAGGGFQHGQHLAFRRDHNKPLCNLFVTMLQQLGIEDRHIRQQHRHIERDRLMRHITRFASRLRRKVLAVCRKQSNGLERPCYIRCEFLLLLTLLPVPLAALHAGELSSDSPEVVVYGATPAGIAAALAAAEGDRSVWLIEPTGRIGGMTTHGLSHSDFHSFEALNGPFLQFSQLVLKHYQDTYGEDSAQVKDSWQGTHGEPSVNLLIFEKMLAERPTITVLTNHRLVEVAVENSTITALKFVLPGSKLVTVEPQLVIDGTYEGDLLAAANVPYRVGREARSEYGESLAPESADDQLQGYNFRLCMTQNPTNRVPVPVPSNYNREDYAAIIPLVKAGEFDAAFGYPGQRFILKAHLPVMPNGKRDINDVSKGLVRLSLPGHNREYPDGDLATRRRIEQKHLDWQLGLMHFVQTDTALPDAFREAAATWGLCRDEFADTGHIPSQIYVREARRMLGLRVYTEADTEYAPNDARARLHPDAIAFGEYSHNCHGTEHEGPLIGGRHTGEFYKGVAPYQIPYGILVPKEIRNLLVPTACSASHVGFCAHCGWNRSGCRSAAPPVALPTSRWLVTSPSKRSMSKR